MVAHSAMFERTFWNFVVRKKFAPHWPALRIEQQECTIANASALGCPAGLEELGTFLGAQNKKDIIGTALMKKMAKPRSVETCGFCGGDRCIACGHTGQVFTWWNSPENIKRVGEYCDDDVEAETDVGEKEIPLSDRERRVWMLDQVINDRGIHLDIPLIHRTQSVVEYAKLQLDARIVELTKDPTSGLSVVTKATQVARIKEWIQAQGIPCTTIAKGAQDDIVALASTLGKPQVEEAIAIRRQAARSSTAKFKRMLVCVNVDDRARGQLFYHGAHTGRKAGRLIQFQNLYRIQPEDAASIRLAIEILEAGWSIADTHDRLEVMFGEPMTMIAKCMRSMITAGPGNHLMGGDLSNIEGCSNAWLSGEDWKIQAYLDYQRGVGPDLYRIAYGRSFGADPTSITEDQRQLGKIQELALGYQGSVGAYYAFTQTYLMKLAPIVQVVRETASPEAWEKALWVYSIMPTMRRYGLPAEVWAAMKIVVDGWRAAHPAITQSWWDLQDAAIEAMEKPTVIVPCLNGRIKYMSNNGFLWCQLPSDRVLAYPKARLTWKDDSTLTLPDGTVEEAYDFTPQMIEFLVAHGADYKKKIKRQVIYEGYDDDKHIWHKKAMYGGQQSENVNSGIARDILVDCGFDLEEAGYPVILDVHDELVTEPPIGHGSVEEVRAIMSRPRAWCPGFPLAAKAWEGPRYGK